MKKIIYSLVIMIAAGSLFTSCVTNTEPQGIKDMREAKADYIASLSKLNKAEEEVVKAKAAYQTAQIAVVEAEAALKQAEADIARALADAAQLGVEYLDATLQMKLETAKVEAEKEVIDAQAKLAQAQFDYEQKIRDLAAKSIGLNDTERKVLKTAIDSLESAQEDYHEAFVSVEKKKMKIWNKEYDHDSIGRGVVDWKAEIAAAEQKIATYEANIADLEEMKEAPETIKAFLEAYQDSVIELRKDTLLAVRQKALYETTVLDEANKAYRAKVKAFKDDSIPKAPKYLFAEINSDKDTVAKTYPLSGTGEGLDTLFAEYVNQYIKHDKSGKTAKQHGISVDSLIKNIEVGGKDVKEADLDTATEILGTIVEALSRHLVVVDDSLRAKTLDSLKKEAAKADTAYWKARKALEAGYTSGDTVEYIKTYEEFFAVKVAPTDTAKALKKVVFTWSDTTFSFKKEDCIVKFDHSGSDTIIATNTLKIVLDGVDEKGYSAGSKKVNESKIFNGTEGLTLFAQAIRKNQLAKEAENFEFLEKQLDNIKTQYAAIVSDLKAYNDQYAADSKAHKDGVKALYGGANKNKYPRVDTLRASVVNVNNGKWDFYGKQVEFANEVAAEYPAIVKAAEDAVGAIKEKIEDTEAFIDFLEKTYVDSKNLEDTTAHYTEVQDIIRRLDRKIAKFEKKIEWKQAYIQECKKNIDKIEAGYDPYTVDLLSEYDQLAKLERELEIAEQQLKIAQAYYDEVIEKYGIKDAE